MAQRPAAKLRMVAVQRRETHCPTLVGWAAVELGRRPVAGRIGRRMVRSTSGGRLHAAPHRVDRAARLVAGEEQDVSDKKPTVAALQRKIDRLTLQVRTLHEERQRAMRNYGDILAEVVELKARADQAIRLLQGEDV